MAKELQESIVPPPVPERGEYFYRLSAMTLARKMNDAVLRLVEFSMTGSRDADALMLSVDLHEVADRIENALKVLKVQNERDRERIRKWNEEREAKRKAEAEKDQKFWESISAKSENPQSPDLSKTSS